VLMATAPGDGRGAPPSPSALQTLTGSSDPAALLGLLFPADQTAALNTYVANIIKRKPVEVVAPAAQSVKQTAASGAWLISQDPDGKRVARLELPTLIGGGELDPLLPVANQRHLHDMIRGSQLVTYPDASHGFLFQHQAEFVPKLLAFLK
jgi:pimeloyl-ACP methyl ester carboxylesterase